jgi:hypothetical protein
MTMVGGGPPVDRAALAPHVGHLVRESIVAAIRWIGPLSAPELKVVLDNPEPQLAHLAFHLNALVVEGALVEIGRRPAGASIEKVYFLASPP